MRPYEELSRLGRIRRMKRLAELALKDFGFQDARLEFLKQAGNTLFRVNEPAPSSRTDTELYTPGQYLLRVHQPGYQSTEAIELELTWLAAMCREAQLPVPEPIPTPECRFLTQVAFPGVPEQRNCSLLRWVRGRYLTKDTRPEHYRAQGRLMARLHGFAAGWKVPEGLTKRKYDWDGLFQDDLGEGMPAKEAWELLPPDYIKAYEEIAGRVKAVMDASGKDKDVYGLIHADLGLDANVLFWKGEARAIDFDDSGFGYYLYDLSLALEHCQEDDRLPQFREALLEGYAQFRTIPADHLGHLDLFQAAFCVYLSLWAVSAIMRYPAHREELVGRMERAFRLAQRYITSA